MLDRTNYREQVKAHLDKWKAELTELKAKIEGAEASARLGLLRQYEELQGRYDKLHEEFGRLADASADAYDRVRGTIDQTVTEFTTRFEALKRELEERAPALR